MKKAFKKMAIALALPILGVIAYNASAQDPKNSGNADCNSYCESSTIYHCLLTYSDGSQVLCLNMQVKGTQPPGS
jgi:hypothetical protein